MKNNQSKWDQIGITASTLCALHCAFMPFIITILPLVGLTVLANPWFEWGMILIALLIGTFTIVKSYFFVHRRFLPMALLMAGLAMIVLARLFIHGWLEALVVPSGGITIASAHFFNSRCLGACNYTSSLPRS